MIENQQDRARLATASDVPFEHRLWDKDKVAAYLGVTVRTVEAWMARRYLPYLKLGKTIRFRMGDVARSLDENFKRGPQ